MTGILVSLNASGENNVSVFNLTNNSNIVSIGELAEKIIALGKNKVKLVIKKRDDNSNTSTSTGRILLNSTKLEKAGWSPKYTVNDCIEKTFNYLQNKE